MRSRIAILIMGILIGGASSALASGAVWKHKEGSVVCVMRPAATACANLRGWAVGISRDLVYVENAKGKPIYFRYLP